MNDIASTNSLSVKHKNKYEHAEYRLFMIVILVRIVSVLYSSTRSSTDDNFHDLFWGEVQLLRL